MILNCRSCTKEFRIKPYRKAQAKYCSRRCQFKGQVGIPTWNKGLKTGIIPKTAFRKGEHFSKATEFKKGQIPIRKFSKGHVPWNKGKTFTKILGKKHWNWKGGKTPSNVKLRNSIEYKQWRWEVYRRDNFLCVNGGIAHGSRLNADHIRPWLIYPELRLSVDNGQTLCESCHKAKTKQDRKFIREFYENTK